MSLNEFSIIDRYFSQLGNHRPEVSLSVGDDCAITHLSDEFDTLFTIDTLVENTHFLSDMPAVALGYKAMAISLSDIAAMGGEPYAALLALTLPSVDEAWLNAFAQGADSILRQFNLGLIGGNLSHGPRNITTQVMGKVPKNQAVLRSGAKPGDLIYVTGTLGDAGAALGFLLSQQQTLANDLRVKLLERFYYPIPRLAVGIALRGTATAMVDISDGLLADLNHILLASKVGAELEAAVLPLSLELQQAVDHRLALKLALTAGEDYELCFTVPQAKQQYVEQLSVSTGCRMTCIGLITKKLGLQVIDANSKPMVLTELGYDHFKNLDDV